MYWKECTFSQELKLQIGQKKVGKIQIEGFALALSVLSWNIIETDSAQSSSNKCKNYLLKIYSQHIKFFNTI